MLEDAKHVAIEDRKKWTKFQENLEEETFRMDKTAIKIFYLELISYFYELNQQLSSVVALKNKVNQNQIKIIVVRSLIYTDKDSSSPALQNEEEEEDNTDHIEMLKVYIQETEDKGSVLDTEINTLKARTANLEREVRRCKEITQEDDLDTQITKLNERISFLKHKL